MKTLLIVNPAAGHGLGRKTFARLESRLRAEIPGLEVRFSERPGHSVDLGREAARGAYDRILCLGGDGTPYEVINGLYAEGRPMRLPVMGQIPAGTGNSFLRDFGIETPEQALEAIRDRPPPQDRPGRVRLSVGRPDRPRLLAQHHRRRPHRRHPPADQRAPEVPRRGRLQPGRPRAPRPRHAQPHRRRGRRTPARARRQRPGRLQLEVHRRQDDDRPQSRYRRRPGRRRPLQRAQPPPDGRDLRRRLLRQAPRPPACRPRPGRLDLGRVGSPAPADGRRRAHRLHPAPAPGAAGRARHPRLRKRP
ncbi:MAG: acylglycerol kinase family protein [Desulfosudis oleivorans]|nr:acylglycerol kinase family protein [Desulfosudis oleivorans]